MALIALPALAIRLLAGRSTTVIHRARIEDRPVESGLLSNVLAWVLDRARGRTGHVP